MPSKFNYFSPFAFIHIGDLTSYLHSTLQDQRRKRERQARDKNRGEMHRCMVTWTSLSQPVFKAHLVTGPQSSHLTLETLCRLRRSVLGSPTAETSAHKAAFRACAASKNDCGQNNLYPGRDILQEWITLCIIQQFSVDANIKKL